MADIEEARPNKGYGPIRFSRCTPMSPCEKAAFCAGIEAARQMVLTAAITIEVRDDAGELRQQAAIAALQGLADGLKVAFLTPPAEPEG